MYRYEQLFSASDDEAAREEGNVYIADLALSGVLIALKGNSAPVRLGFIHYTPLRPDEGEILHDDLSSAIFTEDYKKPGELPRLNEVNIMEDFDGLIKVGADYWDGRPIKTYFTAGDDLSISRLTGFAPFNPRTYDDYQHNEGLAQRVIDDLRQSGDPLSLEVMRNEEGRIFKNLPDAEEFLESIETQEGPSKLTDHLSAQLDRVRRLSDDSN